MKKVLFVTWDGPETNYIESLFLPIFSRLNAAYGHEFHIIQFTWGNPQRLQHTKAICAAQKVAYTSLNVSRKIAMLGLLKALFIQSKFVKRYVATHDIQIIMPRATTSAAIVNRFIKNTKATYLFDADGFSQDERVDFSGWNPKGLRYKMYRFFEKTALKKAHGVLCRSKAAKEILTERAGYNFDKNKITVIANGKDTAVFNMLPKEDFKPTKGVRFIYAGSLGPQYMLPEMLKIFENVVLHNPHSTFTILSGNLDFAEDIISSSFTKLHSKINLLKVLPAEVPSYIKNSDIAFSLRSPKFSMKGVCPIKLGEYLLCGVPVISNTGIGDTDVMLKDLKCAFIINDLKQISMPKISEWCVNVHGDYAIKMQARAVGKNFFDIDKTVALYHKAIANAE
ncbi:MAG: hypothetical protein R2781_10490 [Flavobacteriaceae bacterium]